MPNIYGYADFRLFLKERFEEVKKQRPGWSYAGWAKRVGVRSPATLFMLVHGQRNPGPKLIELLIKDLKLNEKEAEFFRDLVRLKKVRNDPALTVLLMEKLSVRSAAGSFHTLDLEQFESISNWHFYAIRQLTRLRDFKNDPKWIARKLRFPVPVPKIRAAIRTMLDLGHLEKTSSGLRAGRAQLATSNDIASEGLKRFHEQTLENAKTSLRSMEPSKREISGVTFAMNRDDLPKAKELIRRFQRDLCELMEKGEPNTVFHFGTTLVPLTD